jgi:putative restriction endonuclease
MNAQDIKKQFEKITLWKRGGERAPHKPLLILFALSQCLRSNERLISFPEIDKKLKELLIDFGPTRKSYHPEYPFWRLQNDGIWELSNIENVTARKGNTDAKKSELIKYNVHGGFIKEIYDFFKSNKKFIPVLAA